MRSIVGVQKVDGGTVTVLGEPAGSSQLRHRVAYDTQAASVYADLTIRQNLALLRAADRRASQRRRPRDHRGGSHRESQPDRRVAERRPGDARLARGRDARVPAADGPRRADRRARPAAARRTLDGVPCAGRPRHHDHREQPRHGRSAALRPARCSCARAGSSPTRHPTGSSPTPARPTRMPHSSRSSSATQPRRLGAADRHPRTRRESREEGSE